MPVNSEARGVGKFSRACHICSPATASRRWRLLTLPCDWYTVHQNVIFFVRVCLHRTHKHAAGLFLAHLFLAAASFSSYSASTLALISCSSLQALALLCKDLFLCLTISLYSETHFSANMQPPKVIADICMKALNCTVNPRYTGCIRVRAK